MEVSSFKITDILCCPICYSEVTTDGDAYTCSNHFSGKTAAGSNIVVSKAGYNSADTVLSVLKWNEFYKLKISNEDPKELEKTYLEDNFSNVYSQLVKEVGTFKGKIFLEIGCGPFILGQLLAKECQLVIGVDFSEAALEMAQRRMKEKGINNYLLIKSDIRRMPIKNGCVDMLYGGGVLEHFRETQQAVNEFYRVLKPGGITFNTVPALNLGSLTYRQVWGNIPSFPVLKQLAELIHIKLLGAKHMIFGYELSFSAMELAFVHRKAGFKKVTVDKFKTKLMFDFIPGKALKNIFIWMADNLRPFWPMYKVIAKK